MSDPTRKRWTFTEDELRHGLEKAISYADYDLHKALSDTEEEGDTYETLMPIFLQAAIHTGVTEEKE